MMLGRVPASEREPRRRRRELVRQQIQFEDAPEHKRAIYDVERYDNYLALLTTMHHECANPVDWSALELAPAPAAPQRTKVHEDAARRALADYAPGFVDKLFGRASRRLSRLRDDVQPAAATDAWAYEEALHRYEHDLSEWKRLRHLVARVIAGDTAAQLEVVELSQPFAEIQELGSKIDIDPSLRIRLQLNAEDVVPIRAKWLNTDGRLTVRPMLADQRGKIGLA